MRSHRLLDCLHRSRSHADDVVSPPLSLLLVLHSLDCLGNSQLVDPRTNSHGLLERLHRFEPVTGSTVCLLSVVGQVHHPVRRQLRYPWTTNWDLGFLHRDIDGATAQLLFAFQIARDQARTLRTQLLIASALDDIQKDSLDMHLLKSTSNK